MDKLTAVNIAVGCVMSSGLDSVEKRFVIRVLREEEGKVSPKSLEEWHEGIGDVLWWRFPIEEPPYCGTPLDLNWSDDYYTHWTPISIPNAVRLQI